MKNYYYKKYTESDGLNTLLAEDDVASIIIGDDWSTPSQAEWSELLVHCTWIWTSSNGRNGYSVTGPNGKPLKSCLLPSIRGRFSQDLLVVKWVEILFYDDFPWQNQCRLRFFFIILQRVFNLGWPQAVMAHTLSGLLCLAIYLAFAACLERTVAGNSL